MTRWKRNSPCAARLGRTAEKSRAFPSVFRIATAFCIFSSNDGPATVAALMDLARARASTSRKSAFQSSPLDDMFLRYTGSAFTMRWTPAQGTTSDTCTVTTKRAGALRRCSTINFKRIAALIKRTYCRNSSQQWWFFARRDRLALLRRAASQLAASSRRICDEQGSAGGYGFGRLASASPAMTSVGPAQPGPTSVSRRRV